MPPLKTVTGVATNAVYGFLIMFLKLYEEQKPDYVAVAFDRGRDTFRTDIYKEYKAHREAAPDDLKVQFDVVRKLLDALGVFHIDMSGFEGDDLIGSMSKHWGSSEVGVSIVTGDRDSLQLVDAHTKVLLTKKGITELLSITEDTIKEVYGYTAAQVVDMKALSGDSSDNIPGVPGVGEKTACKLLAEYHTLDGIYEGIENIKGKLKEKLIANEEIARLSKELATIKTDIPVKEALTDYEVHADEQKITALFTELGFQKMFEKTRAVLGISSEMNLFDIQEGVEHKKVEIHSLSGWPKESFFTDKRVAFSYEIEGKVPHLQFVRGALYNGEESYILSPSDWDPDTFLKMESLASSWIVMDMKHLHHLILASEKELVMYDEKGGVRYYDLPLLAYLLDPARNEYGIDYLQARFPKHGWDFHEEKDLAYVNAYVHSIVDDVLVEVEDKQLFSLYATMELPLTKTLAYMEHRGIYIDQEALEALRVEFTKEAQDLEHGIYELAGEEFNINSPKQLGGILFDKLSLPPTKKTKTGYSTNVEVLESLKDKHPIIDKILSYRTIKKLLSTYVEGLKPLIDEETGRIHTTFNQMVTATGRLSSSNPNFQNIPVRTEQGKRIRSLFIPGKDYISLMSADYSQIELRILAHVSKDEGLCKAFQQGMDVHRYTAAEVLGKSMEEVSDIERSHAKSVNFGLIYGLSDFGLARDLGISRKEAKAYIENYFTRYASIKGYMDGVIAEARETGCTHTLFGRIRELSDINDRNFKLRSMAERMAMNTPIQGSAADLIKVAMNRVSSRMFSEKLSSRLLLQVHDELVVEVVAGEEERVAVILKEEMEGAYTLSVPLVVDVHEGKNWASAK